MAVKQVNIPFEPRPWQAQVMPIMGHRTCLNVHRGGGKTWLVVYRLIMAALHTKTSNGAPARFAYVGMSQQHAKSVVWGNFQYLLQDFVREGWVQFNGNDLSITLNLPDGNRNQILISGVDSPERNRGLHLHGLVLDEAQECPADTWNLILFPCTMQHRAWIIMIGTPKGPQGLFYDIWNLGNDPTDKSWTTITKTIDDTGEIDAEALAAYRRSATESQFQQEFYCSFSAAITNRVYYNFDIRTAIPIEENVVPHIRKQIKDRGGDLHIGLDFNVSLMPAVIAQKHDGHLEIINEIILTDTTTEEMATRILQHYPNRRIYIYPDAAGNQRNTAAQNTNLEILRQHGFHVIAPPRNPPVMERVQAVNILLENASGQRRLFVSERCVKTIESLTMQEFNAAGVPDKKKGYDHAADALGYLVMGTFPINQPRFRKRGLRF